MGRAGIRFRSLLAPGDVVAESRLAARGVAPARRARGDEPEDPRTGERRVVVAVGIAVALLATIGFQRVFVTPDSLYGMLWGRDLAHGDLPQFLHGPTPHPLTVAMGVATGMLGNSANYVLTWLVLGPLSLGALVAAVFAVGRRLASPAAGGLAALLLLTSSPILGWAASARHDVLFAALVMSALALELARPRRGPLPLLLLATAGLIRPEAWLIAGLYWLWRLRDLEVRAAVLYAALVAAGPCLWVAMDAAITGDPLWSFHLTERGSDHLYGRYTKVENLTHAGADLLNLAGPFALLAAPFAFTRRVRARIGSIWLPGTLLLVSGGVFLLLVARGLASSERYLLLPTCLLAVLAGVAAVQWREFAGPLVIAVMSVFVLGLLIRGDGLLNVRNEIRPHAQWTTEIRELVSRPDVRGMLARCPTAALPGNVVHGWAYWGDRPLDRWERDEAGASRPDFYVAPGSAEVAAKMLTRPRFDEDPSFVVPPGLVAGPSTAAWRLHVSPGSACIPAA